MQLFYTPDIQNAQNIAKNAILSEEEALHALKVLRLQKNDEIILIDGKGGKYKAKILDNQPKKCNLIILETYPKETQKPYFLHIAIAPTKNIERVEWLVEKCTEIGVDKISFLLCQHSERKQLRLDRLEKIAVQAMKQSQKTYLPVLEDVINFKMFIEQQNANAQTIQKFIAHVADGENKGTEGIKKQFLSNILDKKSNYLILIGPEGDFSEQEIEIAIENNFLAVSLGNSILRTETAAVVACTLAQAVNS
jgi:16S rRNA (uracil1498-N3)-methyltransferase